MSASQRLRQAVRLALQPERERPGLVLAVSGGADSVALLRAVHELRLPGKSVVAHLNHRLRGAESDADEAFVAQLTGSLGLPFVRTAVEVRERAEAEHANLEATARTVRYEWLASVAREQGLDRIATGHTASDQAETVLLRLLRGAGFQGLRGIAGERTLEPGLVVLRPLRTVTRGEVLAYLDEIGQNARHDPSNDDASLRRNRIRHQLLPLLESDYNPAIARVLARLAEQAEDFFQEEEASATELLALAERPRAGTMVVLDRRTLQAVPRSRVRSLLRAIYRREGWSQDDIPFAMWDRMAGVVWDEEPALDLPHGVRIERRENVVRVYVNLDRGNENA